MITDKSGKPSHFAVVAVMGRLTIRQTSYATPMLGNA